MLTPTAAMTMRLAGPGAQRTLFSTTFAVKTAAAPASISSPFKSAMSTQSRPLSILTCSAARGAFRQISSSPSAVVSQVFRRQASTSSSTTANAQATGQLDWNSFFKLRKTRRRWQLLFSVAMLGVSGTAGAAILATGVADPIVGQVPLDPFVTLGLMVMGFAALGWLSGPSIGSAVFNTINRQWKKQITQKEIEFFARVKKNRVDPSSSGTSNPVPDFYGENISSVSGYRQWLKDQRAFNKKRTRFV